MGPKPGVQPTAKVTPTNHEPTQPAGFDGS
jgi:hypothetical protein